MAVWIYWWTFSITNTKVVRINLSSLPYSLIFSSIIIEITTLKHLQTHHNATAFHNTKEYTPISRKSDQEAVTFMLCFCNKMQWEPKPIMVWKHWLFLELINSSAFHNKSAFNLTTIIHKKEKKISPHNFHLPVYC